MKHILLFLAITVYLTGCESSTSDYIDPTKIVNDNFNTYNITFRARSFDVHGDDIYALAVGYDLNDSVENFDIENRLAVWHSSDLGRSWEKIHVMFPKWAGINCSYCYLNNYHFVFMTNTLFKSLNGSKSIEQLNEPDNNNTTDFKKMSIIKIDRDEQNIFALTNKYLFKSSDFGSNWIKLFDAQNDTLVNFYVFGSMIIGINKSSINISNDAGNSWFTAKGFDISDLKKYISIVKSKNGKLYLAGYENNFIYTSADSGHNWIKTTFQTEKSYYLIRELVAVKDDGTLLAGFYTQIDHSLITESSNNKDWNTKYDVFAFNLYVTGSGYIFFRDNQGKDDGYPLRMYYPLELNASFKFRISKKPEFVH